MSVVAYTLGAVHPAGKTLPERGMVIHFNELYFDVLVTGLNAEELSQLKKGDFKYGLFEQNVPFFVLNLCDRLVMSCPFNIRQIGNDRAHEWLEQEYRLASICVVRQPRGILETVIPLQTQSFFKLYLKNGLYEVIDRYRNKKEVDEAAELLRKNWSPEQMFEYVFAYSTGIETAD